MKSSVCKSSLHLCGSLFLLLLLTLPTAVFALPQVNLVIVKKSEAKLYLMKDKKVFKSYHIAFGRNSKGKKLKQGDKKTPEGKYILDYKNAHSGFYKSIHISYPNKSDKERARKAHVNPGGNIMIHGQKNGWEWASFITQYFNWTKGCIAVSNINMDEIWKTVKVGTPIEILP